jgi:signal transduction histidine kinase
MMSRIDSRYWAISTGRHFQNGHHNTAKIQHCPISSQFDIMLIFCDIVVAILKIATNRNCSMSGLNSGHHYLPTYQIVMISDNVVMSWIDSWHWKISTGRHFQNGRHNTAKNQHCPISSKFEMWVHNDVPTLKNFYRSPPKPATDNRFK